ncbi:MAG: HEAT repeat domain-containing protein [Planctomycetales bacterium]|nr:HEAT repeat domain-containing protein [Planctomycetales bacterium]
MGSAVPLALATAALATYVLAVRRIEGSRGALKGKRMAFWGMALAAGTLLHSLFRCGLLDLDRSFSKELTETIAAEPIPVTLGRLQSPHWTVRLAAIQSLRKWSARTAPVVDTVAESLKDENARVRKAAAECLGYLGQGLTPPLARPVLDALARALRDDDRQVRMAAAKSLGRIGPAARAIPGLEATLAGNDEDIRNAYSEGWRGIEGG